MAMLEERLNDLAEDYAAAIQQVITKLDEHAAIQREMIRDVRERARARPRYARGMPAPGYG